MINGSEMAKYHLLHRGEQHKFASLSPKHHINGLSPQPTQIPDTQGLA